eukprot:TRINITY_DN21999_c0_g1_i1.p1 TRINITY_DN21999_c0_g1~~TRINITY_DN21999_c0_g1_i1.p1  ORF type:complete len:548 (-),score=90.05 TRINITY_DN21999_c0_g1_i1:452-2095(-)
MSPLAAIRLVAVLFILALMYHRHDARYDSLPVKEPKMQEESRLLNYLMANYDREVRPVYNASKAVVVRVGITLTQIFDMDEKNQVMTTNIWLDQEWKDEMMRWDPKDFNGITKLQVPCDKLWLPDIVLYNSADDYSKGYFRSLATVDHTGNVFWPPPTKFRSTCPVNVMYFPFDDQTCNLKLSSWMYDGTKVDVTNRTNNVDLENYVPNGEWELLETRLIRAKQYFPCCPEPYPYVTVTVKIRRKTLYYMYNIVFPCMMMSTLTVLVFCMPPDSGEKIALGVTVILAFSVFMLAIAERMPETSESIPLIGIYLTFVMAMTTVSVIMTVMVLNFFYRGPVLTEVPSWARRYIMRKGKLKKTAFPFRSSFQSSSQEAGHSTRSANWSKLTEKYSLDLLKSQIIKATRRRDREGNNGSIPRQSYAGPQVMPKPVHIQPREVEEDAFIGISDPISGSFRSPCPRLDIRMMDCPGTSNGRLGDDDQDDLVKVVRTLLDKEDQQTKDDQIRREWRMLAETVDCWLFWSFFFITTISTLLFLVILPYNHRGKFF